MSAALLPTFEGDWTFDGGSPFQLSAGGELQPLTLHYALYGALNAERDNAVLVCHALSGSASVADWWPGLFGPGRVFDTTSHCIIGINVIGSCYGSTGPGSLNARTGTPYRSDFPLISVSDIVRAQALLLDHLGIKRLQSVIGGSIGGMQALQWAVDYPERVAKCIAIAATPLPAMGLALNHLQRQTIQLDPSWRGGNYTNDAPPVKGLTLARALAMCSYKSPELFDERFARQPDRTGEDPYRSLPERFDIAGYLDYQGSTFTRRFDANSYLVLSKAMDTFHLGRDQQEEAATLSRISAQVHLIGITSDWLFPAADVRALATQMQSAGVDCHYAELVSSHGHDGFLADVELLAPLLKAALCRETCTQNVRATQAAM